MTVTGIDASYYYAKDFDRAVSFYQTLIGAPPAGQFAGTFAEWVFSGGEAFGIYKGAEFHPGSGVMFAVPDVPAAVEELRARGVHFSAEIEETPVCFMAFGTDSEGNGFILHKRK